MKQIIHFFLLSVFFIIFSQALKAQEISTKGFLFSSLWNLNKPKRFDDGTINCGIEKHISNNRSIGITTSIFYFNDSKINYHISYADFIIEHRKYVNQSAPKLTRNCFLGLYSILLKKIYQPNGGSGQFGYDLVEVNSGIGGLAGKRFYFAGHSLFLDAGIGNAITAVLHRKVVSGYFSPNPESLHRFQDMPRVIISLGLTFKKKHEYNIDKTQNLKL